MVHLTMEDITASYTQRLEELAARQHEALRIMSAVGTLADLEEAQPKRPQALLFNRLVQRITQHMGYQSSQAESVLDEEPSEDAVVIIDADYRILE